MTEREHAEPADEQPPPRLDPRGRVRASLSGLRTGLAAGAREAVSVARRDPTSVLLWIVALVVANEIAGQFLSSVGGMEVNRDAGAYIPRARTITFGLTPYRDFELSYPPLPLYLWAALGNKALLHPPAYRGLQFLMHFISFGLTFGVLRAMRAPTSHAALATALLMMWVWIAEGWTIGLAAFVNVFVLATFLVLAKPAGRRRAFFAGVLFGCAIMSKQYALLSLPAALLWLVAGTRERRALSDASRDDEPLWRRLDLDVLAMFLVACGVPFLVFLLFTGLPWVDTFLHLASFGGRAGDSYKPGGLMPLLVQGSREVAFSQLLVPAGVALALVVLRRDLRTLGLGLAFAGNACALLVRTFPHYLQLVLPFALLSVGWVALGSKPRARRHGVIAALALALLVSLWSQVRTPKVPIGYQRQLASALQRRIPPGSRVMMCNRLLMPLYALVDIRAPLDNYRFQLEPRREFEERRDAADYAVCLPDDLERRGFKRWLERGGLTSVNDRPLGVLKARILYRPGKALRRVPVRRGR